MRCCAGARPAPDENLKGYAVVMRATTSPFWEQEIYVGKVTEFTLKGVSIDDTVRRQSHRQ